MIESGSVKHFSVSIAEDDLENGVFQVLQHIRPEWKPSDVRLRLLTDGITNKLMKCHEGPKEDDVVLVRVYGRKTDLFIDRAAETKNIILLHSENLAPRLHATFSNGLAYEFVPGVTLTRETVRSPKVFLLIAEKMAKLHRVKSSEMTNEPIIWDKIDKFYNLIPEQFTNPHLQKRFKKTNITKEKLLHEINHLKLALMYLNSPVVFCHNDLLLGNVIYNSDNESVTFIDYEYAGMNYQAFDIGNHFNEFAGVENIDYNYYPGRTFQTAWLSTYLREYHGREDVTFDEIDEMYVLVNKFGLLSHILWGLWALIQAEHSTLDFDFLRFGFDHLNRYFETKNDFISLQPRNKKECQSKNCQL